MNNVPGYDSTKFFDHVSLMWSVPVSQLTWPTEPNDTTHRFYRCVKDSKRAVTCTQVLKETPFTEPESFIVTIKKGCPKKYDSLALSWKTGAIVSLR